MARWRCATGRSARGEAWPGDADVFVYFNNDQHAAALYDAAAFASLARRAGRQVTATPTPGG
jgi:uncharacterized protein YecE (DUF72 family)